MASDTRNLLLSSVDSAVESFGRRPAMPADGGPVNLLICIAMHTDAWPNLRYLREVKDSQIPEACCKQQGPLVGDGF